MHQDSTLFSGLCRVSVQHIDRGEGKVWFISFRQAKPSAVFASKIRRSGGDYAARRMAPIGAQRKVTMKGKYVQMALFSYSSAQTDGVAAAGRRRDPTVLAFRAGD